MFYLGHYRQISYEHESTEFCVNITFHYLNSMSSIVFVGSIVICIFTKEIGNFPDCTIIQVHKERLQLPVSLCLCQNSVSIFLV